MLGDGSAQAPWQGICGVGAPPPALPAWGAWGGILAPPRAAPRVRTRLPATFRRAQAPNANRWRRPGPAPASRPGGGAGTGFGPALIPVQDLRRPGRGPRCDGCPPPTTSSHFPATGDSGTGPGMVLLARNLTLKLFQLEGTWKITWVNGHSFIYSFTKLLFCALLCAKHCASSVDERVKDTQASTFLQPAI